MADSLERIAVLESEVRSMKEHQDEILKCMQSIRDEMTRYKGFIGGIAFVVSCLGVALTVFKEWIIKHFLS
jgi:hypothetical protein